MGLWAGGFAFVVTRLHQSFFMVSQQCAQTNRSLGRVVYYLAVIDTSVRMCTACVCCVRLMGGCNVHSSGAARMARNEIKFTFKICSAAATSGLKRTSIMSLCALAE
jgi:hypothetical protein